MSETYDYYQVHARLGDALDTYPNGVHVQEIELIVRDHPEFPSWEALDPAICHLDARRARELAFELLMLAEHAEQIEQTGSR
jgi:hypothetical protein